MDTPQTQPHIPKIFTHPEIELLYQNSFRIDQSVLKQILALPRETLIADLEKVLDDSIARFEDYSDMDLNASTGNFLFHALYLLIELQAEDSLQKVLTLFRQDDGFLEYWFDDFLTEGTWEIIYHFGKNRLDELKQFLLEPNRYLYARGAITTAIEQIVLYNSSRRQELIAWYSDVFDKFLANPEDETIVDAELIGFMVADVLSFQGIELDEKLKALHQADIVSLDICGDWKHVQKELYHPSFNRDRKMEIFTDIFSRYNNILNTWHFYKNEYDLFPEKEDEEDDFDYMDDDDFDDNFEDNFEDNFDEYEEVEKEHEPEFKLVEGYKHGETFIKLTTNTGRNEPCPCGSGLKYKKCCGK